MLWDLGYSSLFAIVTHACTGRDNETKEIKDTSAFLVIFGK